MTQHRYNRTQPRHINTPDHSDPGLWFLRGLEQSVSISESPGLSSPPPGPAVFPAAALGLTEELRFVTFANATDHLCFVQAAEPRTVCASALAPAEGLTGLLRRPPPVDARSCVAVDAEIAGISAQDDRIFVLSVQQGRRAGHDVWAIDEYDLVRDLGFFGPSRHRRLALEGREVPAAGVSFGVQRAARGHYAALAFSDGSPCLVFDLGDEPTVAPREVTGLSDVSAILPRNSEGPSPDFLVAAKGPSLAVLSNLTAALPSVRPFVKSAALGGMKNVTSLARVRFRLAAIGQGVFDQPNEEVDLTVAAVPGAFALWTVGLYGSRVALPLVGGGPVPTTVTASNLIELNVGSPDTVCALHSTHLLFGRRDSTEWHVLIARSYRKTSRGPQPIRVPHRTSDSKSFLS